jgi:hypothetical protein
MNLPLNVLVDATSTTLVLPADLISTLTVSPDVNGIITVADDVICLFVPEPVLYGLHSCAYIPPKLDVVNTTNKDV